MKQLFYLTHGVRILKQHSSIWDRERLEMNCVARSIFYPPAGLQIKVKKEKIFSCPY